MLVLLIQILFAIVMLAVAIMGAFIVFHIVRYAYSTLGMLVTLLLFIPVAAVLFLTNIALFSNIDLASIFSNF